MITAKQKFLNNISEIMEQEPQLILFYYRGVPVYSFTNMKQKKLKYELLHITTDVYIELWVSSLSMGRLRQRTAQMLHHKIDKVEVLLLNDEVITYETIELEL
ncbi:MAG: hypothetical protein KAH10_08625 [Flavobacteriales bacterium]|nr:hypothetical protein [Flavobacteriales bacterium]